MTNQISDFTYPHVNSSTTQLANQVVPPATKSLLKIALDVFSNLVYGNQVMTSAAYQRMGSVVTQNAEAEQIKSRSGHIWECKERKADGKGFIYIFEFKIKYRSQSAFNEITDKIYPAIEPSDNHLRQILGSNLLLNELGYKLHSRPYGIYMDLPDKEALLERWKMLKANEPELPDLDIVSSEGIAGDLAFVEAYLKHDALLSFGIEFVHDNIYHLIPALKSMLNLKKNYKSEKEAMAKRVNAIYQRIMKADNSAAQTATKTQHYEQLITSVAYLVDVISSGSIDTGKEVFIYAMKSSFKHFLDHPGWKNYMTCRFGAEVDPEAIASLWHEIAGNDKHLMLEIVKEYGLALQYANEDLKNDEDIVLVAVRNNGPALQYANEALKSKEEIALAAVQQDSSALTYVDKALEKKLILQIVKNDDKALKYASEDLKNNIELVLAAVQLNSWSLKYASEDLKNNIEVVMAAVQQQGLNLGYASQDLKNNIQVALAAVKQDGWALQYVSQELKSNETVVLAAINQIATAFKYASESSKDNETIVLAAVKQNGEELQYASEAVKNNIAVVMAAVQQNGMALQHASEAMKNNIAVVMAAVQQNGMALRYASEALTSNKEVVMAAVQQNGMALLHASKVLKKNIEVVMAAVQQDGWALQFASEVLKNNIAVVMAAVQQNSAALQLASQALKDNEKIRAAIKG